MLFMLNIKRVFDRKLVFMLSKIADFWLHVGQHDAKKVFFVVVGKQNADVGISIWYGMLKIYESAFRLWVYTVGAVLQRPWLKHLRLLQQQLLLPAVHAVISKRFECLSVL